MGRMKPAMFGVSGCCFGVLLLVGGVMLEDRVIIDTIEDDHNSTGVENMDVDTMTMDDEAIIKFNSSYYDIVTNENTEEVPTVDDDNMTVVGETCGNSSLVERMINATKHRG